MRSKKHDGSSAEKNALACGECGAGLPPPNEAGRASCVYCGAEHRSDRSSEVLAVALAQANRESGTFSVSEPLNGEDAARIPLTDDSVLRLLREHFASSNGAGRVYVCPHLPPPKEQSARRAHVLHLPDRERILALYDATWFGNGDEGFIITSRRLCWKNAGESANSIEWRDLDPDQIDADRRRLFIGNDPIAIADEDVLDACADAFHVLALSGMPPRAKVSGILPAPVKTPAPPKVATPPPATKTSFAKYASSVEAHAPDRACWHCRTPLYATTPQCAYCGALPKKKGWRKTA
jgi:hypothetical protein